VKVEALKKYFRVRTGFFAGSKRWVRAVDDVNLTINKGETLAIVGESGCGKTTLGRVILRLLTPTDGRITFANMDITKLSQREVRHLRRRMQMVFQDPYWSLNPTMLVKDIVAEPLRTHLKMSRKEIEDRVLDLLSLVGLGSDAIRRYPHEFSGGQRQRIGIARALATNPEFIVLDEPTSFLDVSVQAHIVNLIKDLQQKLGLTYLFISHNLGIVQHVSDEIAVMYVGRIAERGSVEQVFEEPLHPYTQALMASIPVADPDVKKKEVILEGTVPSPDNPPPGCRFSTRCPFAYDKCRQEEPQLVEMSEGHWASCFLLTDQAQPKETMQLK
jgi:oligopeptide/dipeptide ABC transporter ATP-binding protein